VVDVFEEVEEHLRSDQYAVLARKYLPWIGGAFAVALLIALGVWGVSAYRLQNAQKASQAYAQGMESVGRGDMTAAYTQFGVAATSQSKAYKSLALMQQAGIRMDQKNIPEAVKLLDAAAKAAPAPVIGDFASLKAAYLLLDTTPLAQLETRLLPLTAADRPYAALAREALAVSKLMAGKTKDARNDFAVLVLTPSASDDTRRRAQMAMSLIDSGTAASLPATVRMAMTMPPAPPMLPQGPAVDGSAPTDQTAPSGADQ
jgi:hypothetical protein